jgi:hypothetical protein
MDSAGFTVDEEPLRQWVLKAYHEKRSGSEAARRALHAVRQLLSGAPGGESVTGRYWFEEDPFASARSFVEDLELASPGLARLTFEPLLEAMSQAASKGSSGIAPNVPVYISSLAGAMAVKSGLDELIANAVLSAAVLGLSRAGRGPFDAALGMGSGREPGTAGTPEPA